MLDKYTHSSLVYYKHNGDDELCDLFLWSDMIRAIWSADICDKWESIYNMNRETLARAASEIGEMFIAICNDYWQLKHLQRNLYTKRQSI